MTIIHDGNYGDHTSKFWRHKKTGGVYQFVIFSIMESDRTPLVTYRHVLTGEVWTRPADEFHDGRFEQLWNWIT